MNSRGKFSWPTIQDGFLDGAACGFAVVWIIAISREFRCSFALWHDPFVTRTRWTSAKYSRFSDF